MTWHIAMSPMVPLYWRDAPAQSAEDFSSAVSSTISTASPVLEMAGGPGRGGVQHLLVIADRAGQQVLHPVRPGVPGRLGDRPAVVILEFHQQAVHHVAAGQAGLPPGKARCDPSQQVIEQRGLGVMGYRGISGCRVLVCLTNLMITAAAPLRGPRLTCANNPTVTNYSCRNIRAPDCLDGQRAPISAVMGSPPHNGWIKGRQDGEPWTRGR